MFCQQTRNQNQCFYHGMQLPWLYNSIPFTKEELKALWHRILRNWVQLMNLTPTQYAIACGVVDLWKIINWFALKSHCPLNYNSILSSWHLDIICKELKMIITFRTSSKL
jgi:hypothetical protein